MYSWWLLYSFSVLKRELFNYLVSLASSRRLQKRRGMSGPMAVPELQQLPGLQWLSLKSTIFPFISPWGSGPAATTARTWFGSSINFPIIPRPPEGEFREFKRLTSWLFFFFFTLWEGSENFSPSLNHQFRSFWVKTLWCSNMKACPYQSAEMWPNRLSDGPKPSCPFQNRNKNCLQRQNSSE